MMLTIFGIPPSGYWRTAMFACGATIAALFRFSALAEVPAIASPQPAWGRIIPETNGAGVITLEIDSWPRDGMISLPLPFPNITAARLPKGIERESLNWVSEPDGPRLFLQVPTRPPANLPASF
jgi:hypothetical protein